MRFFRKKLAEPEPRKSPFSDDTTLGNILMKMRVLTRDQLLSAIGRKAQHDDMLLGALLKEMGFVTDEQVARALTIQAKLRKGDAGEAAMELMELRLEQFGAREEELTRQIEKQKREQRDRGEATGVWLVPLSPGGSKA